MPQEAAGGAGVGCSLAVAHLDQPGVDRRLVLRDVVDAGACYRSGLWRAACIDSNVTHTRTLSCRPQTNGKVERFHRTVLTEWAYIRPCSSDSARSIALRRWLRLYDHHRTHTAVGGCATASRVTNLSAGTGRWDQ